MYDYTIEHIQDLLGVTRLRNMSLPDGFADESIETLQRVYNGVGAEAWSSKFRSFVTRLLEDLEAPALIHDWEYTFQPKNYKAFTKANFRLCINAWKDHRFKVGLGAAILCQLFGYSGYKETHDVI